MDCSTARLFLQLGQPGAPRELDDPEAAELEAHLAECNACHGFDTDQRRLDNALGQAMLAVEVPAGLKEQIQLRLAADRGARQRRWGGRVFLSVGAAAAAVLLALGLWAIFSPLRPTIAAVDVARDYNIAGRDSDSANAQLRKLGLAACAPKKLNYAYLTGVPSKAALPGTEEWKSPILVAQFVFAKKEEKANHKGEKLTVDQRAIVYAIPRRLANVEPPEGTDQGYTYSVDSKVYEDTPNFVHLILHTGKDWTWLEVDNKD